MNNLVPLNCDMDDEKLFNDIINKLKGRKFIAISYDKHLDKWQEHVFYMHYNEIVAACELMKHSNITEWIEQMNEENY